MAFSHNVRFAAISLANALLPVAVLVFASGFFPYKPVLPGLATFEEVYSGADDAATQPPALFDRVIFMVVDALRSDFVYGHGSGFEFTQSLIRSGAAIPYTAHATPPTVTMPRVKALTTGSVPSFLDLILNFAESDTSSSLAAQDTWLAQLRARGGNSSGAEGGGLVFYGDDTWLKLFPDPDFFARVDGTSSFFVSDFIEVDANVTRHVPAELARDDWRALVMHYLGLDHIGHKTGPAGPQMLPKQREMDAVVQQIFRAMEGSSDDNISNDDSAHKKGAALFPPLHANTLLVLAGDHGMNAGGNHGGSGPGETEPALLFASPKLRENSSSKQQHQRAAYACPTTPQRGSDFHFYRKVAQADVVPSLAALLGLPVPRNSLGVLLPELAALWGSAAHARTLRRQNARQLLRIVEATFGAARFQATAAHFAEQLRTAASEAATTSTTTTTAESDPFSTADFCERADEGEQRLACLWAAATGQVDGDEEAADAATTRFLLATQEALSGTASAYKLPRMLAGLGLAAAILALALLSLPAPELRAAATGAGFLALASILYAAMMFASSYVEEEQHFWYWLAPAWLLLVCWQRMVGTSAAGRDWGRARATVAAVVLLAVHRLAVRWNQTGQKHAGAPDIVHAFFPSAHGFMWLLVLLAYAHVAVCLVRRTFAGLMSPPVMATGAAALVLPAVVFKLNFTNADAPELVQGLGAQIIRLTAPYTLVAQARLAFAGLALATGAVVALSVFSAKASERAGLEESGLLPSLAERLHPLLTLFLMTQTRAPNIPLLLGMELQRTQLAYLMRSTTDSAPIESGKASAITVATTTLLLSHVYFFSMGGSNSISSIDLSNAYNGVADYNIVAVGVLLFAGNWAGPIWWCSAAALLLTQRAAPAVKKQPQLANGTRPWVDFERSKLHDDAVKAVQAPPAGNARAHARAGTWMCYVSAMTAFVSVELLAVMAACTALRTHLFIWTVFSPKYLYSMAWSVLWHLLVNVGLGNLLFKLSAVS